MSDRPFKLVHGQACICTEPGFPADGWHDRECDRWRATGGKLYDEEPISKRD
jgi:hypothetical protein